MTVGFNRKSLPFGRAFFCSLRLTGRRGTIGPNTLKKYDPKEKQHELSRLYAGVPRGLPGAARCADGSEPRCERGRCPAGGERGHQQGVRHRLRHLPLRRHRCVPHSGALGAGGQREVPRDLAFFAAAQEQHGLLPERHDLPGQDGVPLCHPQRDRFQEPDGRVPERRVLPAGHGGQGRVRAGGLAPGRGRHGERCGLQ